MGPHYGECVGYTAAALQQVNQSPVGGLGRMPLILWTHDKQPKPTTHAAYIQVSFHIYILYSHILSHQIPYLPKTKVQIHTYS